MLFIKLTGELFLQGQFFKFAEFWVFRMYISKLRVRVFVEQVKSVLLPEMDRMKLKVWAGSLTYQ